MEQEVSTGWMKLALRVRICTQCDPATGDADVFESLDAHTCEPRCALFCQLPRIARLLKQYHPRPPSGYEDFAIQLLSESGSLPRMLMHYAPEALATLERVAGFVHESRRDMTRGPINSSSQK